MEQLTTQQLKDKINNKENYLNSFNQYKSDLLKENKEIYLEILKQLSLSILDKNWHNHIQELNNIRMSVSLRGYAGKDPLEEFRKASFFAFNQLVYDIQKQIVMVLNNVKLRSKENDKGELVEIDTEVKKIGRNNPCPCGSGKKYKHCHGLN